MKKKYKLDVYKKEGVWFPDIDWFMENKIDVLWGAQQADDIVLVGAGCLHW